MRGVQLCIACELAYVLYHIFAEIGWGTWTPVQENIARSMKRRTSLVYSSVLGQDFRAVALFCFPTIACTSSVK